MQRMLLGLIGLLALVALALGLYTYLASQNPADASPTAASSQGQAPAAGPVTAEGTILPRQHATLAFSIGGRVTDVRVKEGDTVLREQVLVRLDDTTLQSQVAQAEAGLTVAQKQLEQLKTGATAAQRQAAQDGVAAAQAKYDDARATGNNTAIKAAAAALSDAKSALARLDPTPQQLAIAEAQASQAEAALAAARSLQQQAFLTAPFSGTIAQVNLNTGDFAAPSIPVIVLGDLTGLRVETNDVSDLDIGRARTGQPVAVTVDALPGQLFHGTIATISPMATESRGYQVFRVWIDLKEGVESGLRWGMAAKVQIPIEPQQ